MDRTSPTTYVNPVYPHPAADPFVFSAADDGFLAISTNNGREHVPLLRSADLVHWTPAGDAMPELAGWVRRPGRSWAPEVLRFGDRWVMYYTNHDDASGVQCVGVAVAEAPEGPYVDDRDSAFIAEVDGGGSIDASPFRDADGTAYLLWKNDGNAIGVDTWISVQQLGADGLELVGEPTRLIRQDAPWEGSLVEGPALWRHDGDYVLFYSGEAFDTDRYAVGYAVGPGPLGPFTKAPENPILTSRGRSAGPGHCSLIAVGGVDWMVYHSWHAGAVTADPQRTMWLDRVDWVDGRPVIDGPSDSPRPAPLIAT